MQQRLLNREVSVGEQRRDRVGVLQEEVVERVHDTAVIEAPLIARGHDLAGLRRHRALATALAAVVPKANRGVRAVAERHASRASAAAERVAGLRCAVGPMLADQFDVCHGQGAVFEDQNGLRVSRLGSARWVGRVPQRS